MLPASGLAGKKFLFATSQAAVKIVPGEEFMTANKTVVATKLAEDDKLVEIREIGTEVDGDARCGSPDCGWNVLKIPAGGDPGT